MVSAPATSSFLVMVSGLKAMASLWSLHQQRPRSATVTWLDCTANPPPTPQIILGKTKLFIYRNF